MRKTIAIGMIFALVAVVFAAVPANAAITTFTNPDATYLAAATAKIDISGFALWSNHDSITDGTQTVTFSPSMQKAGPVSWGWATWSSPPYSETANPHVLHSNSVNSLTMTLSKPTTVFGFELEPNLFNMYSFTADFYTGSTLVGSITRDVHGSSGARLFAAETQSTSFDKVEISVVGSPYGFAIAQIRYNPYDPEEATEEINEYILDLPDDAWWKNADQRANALSNKVDAVLNLINNGEYETAIDKLTNDIRPKCDGNPDPPDWITNGDAQADLLEMIDELIVHLETLI